jgi:glycosyltransferase involved in cell wall biosynthesis
MHLSVIIPAYNEEKNLINLVKYDNYLKQQGYDYEIIIVNDGSTDKTKEIAKNFAFKNKKIKFIDNKINKGKGAAVRQGLLSAKGDYRLFIDMDGATSINHTDKIWPYFNKGYDIVIGSRDARDIEGAQQVVSQPSWKRFLGRCGNFLIQKLTINRIWDTQCGFKAFTKETVENIFTKTKINRWAIDVEILVLAQCLNYKIAVVPVHWIDAGQSRVGFKGYFSTLNELLKIKRNLIKGRYN